MDGGGGARTTWGRLVIPDLIPPRTFLHLPVVNSLSARLRALAPNPDAAMSRRKVLETC